jgi:hypothetical protein
MSDRMARTLRATFPRTLSPHFARSINSFNGPLSMKLHTPWCLGKSHCKTVPSEVPRKSQ